MSQQPKKYSPIIYIISPTPEAFHIKSLTRQLIKNKIPYKLQKQYDCLKIPLDRKYFIIVDNQSGPKSLGYWFNSLLLFIVGYPKIGNNQKNYYSTKTSQILSQYQLFCKGNLPIVNQKYITSNIVKNTLLQLQNQPFKQSHSCLNQQSQTDNKINEVIVNKNSKLFLLFSQYYPQYNKWIVKITKSNPQKFQLIYKLQNIQSSLYRSRTYTNFLLLTSIQYQKISHKKWKTLQYILYTQNLSEIHQNGKNIIKFCTNKFQIVNTIRILGFQVTSLKDIDKSILKYDNPFAYQLKQKSNRKIMWPRNSKLSIKRQSIIPKNYSLTNSQSSRQSITIKQSKKLTIHINTSSSNQQQRKTLPNQCQIQNNRNMFFMEYHFGINQQKNNRDKRNSNSFTKGQEYFIKTSKSAQKPIQKTIQKIVEKQAQKPAQKLVQKQTQKPAQKQTSTTPVPSTPIKSLKKVRKIKQLHKCKSVLQKNFSSSQSLEQAGVENLKILNVVKTMENQQPSSVQVSENIKQIKNNINPQLNQSKVCQSANQSCFYGDGKPKTNVTNSQFNQQKVCQRTNHNVKSMTNVPNPQLNQQKICQSIIYIDEKPMPNVTNPQQNEQKVCQSTTQSCFYGDGKPTKVVTNSNKKPPQRQKNKNLVVRTSTIMNQNKQNIYNKTKSITQPSHHPRSFSTDSYNSKQMIYKKLEMGIQQSQLHQLIINKQNYLTIQSQNILVNNQIIIYWKDFNFYIQENLHFIQLQLDNLSLYDRSFYNWKQLNQLLKNQGNRKIAILTDQSDIKNLFKMLLNWVDKKSMIGVFIFTKEYKTKQQFQTHIKNIIEIKDYDMLKNIINPIIQNKYTDQQMLPAKQITNFLLTVNNM